MQPYDELSAREQRYARMLFFAFWRTGGGFSRYHDGLDRLAQHSAVRAELVQVLDLVQERSTRINRPLEAGMEDVTMRTDAHYSLEEVLAALDCAWLERPPSSFREGVLRSERAQTDAFFVTLKKSERDYSPTTMYRDYALSPELFHWESQNQTSVDSRVSRRYLAQREAGIHVVLLLRERIQNECGGTQSYTCLGPATYESHRGSKPIAFSYRLKHEMRIQDNRVASVIS